METSDLRREAERLLAEADADPAAVVGTGPAVARRAADAGDAAAEAVACRAVGLAAARLGHVQQALGWLRRGHAAAGRSGDGRLQALVEVTYSAVLGWSGDTAAALRMVGRALGVLSGPDHARALAQRGQMLLRLGRFRAALRDLDEAAARLDTAGDDVWLARALTNRALTRTYAGSLAEAEADLRAALALYEQRGAESYVAEALVNLGWVHSQRGAIVSALRHFDRAEAYLARLGYPLGPLLRDRSEVLVAAQLTGEALDSARRAAAEMRSAGNQAGYLEALVTLARANLAAGDAEAAARVAAELASEAQTQRRAPLRWHGEYLHLEARARMPGPPPRPGEPLRVARRLHALGWVAPAVDARLLAVELALRHRRPADARRWLASVPTGASHAAPPVRARAHLARARLAVAAGRRGAAMRALGAGMTVVDRYQASVGATETRAALARHGAALGRLGVELAAEAGPRRLLAWLERSRASALRYPPAGPPEDARFTAAQARLRWVEAQLSEERDPRRLGELGGMRAALEVELAAQARQSPGGARVAEPVAVPELLEHLGDRAMVVYGEVGGELHAVVAHGGRARHQRLGSAGDTAARLVQLRGALRRIGARYRSGGPPPAGYAGVVEDRESLDRVLLGGLRLPADVPLVLVPPPSLFAVPWGLLRSAQGRAVSVAPSAATWLACSAHAPRERVLVAHGPRLDHGARESRLVAAVYPDATRYKARGATVETIRSAIGDHDVVHLVCHGLLRGDNPQFSTLELIDGPLNVFDLERISRPPGLMVLSACDAGLPAARPGNEIMGFVASLLALGTGAVVAGVGLVPDAGPTAAFMVRFHRAVAAGESPAAALAACTAPLDPDDPADAALAGFVCFGGG